MITVYYYINQIHIIPGIWGLCAYFYWMIKFLPDMLTLGRVAPILEQLFLFSLCFPSFSTEDRSIFHKSRTMYLIPCQLFIAIICLHLLIGRLFFKRITLSFCILQKSQKLLVGSTVFYTPLSFDSYWSPKCFSDIKHPVSAFFFSFYSNLFSSSPEFSFRRQSEV